MKNYLLFIICVFLYSTINAQDSITYTYNKEDNTRIFTIADNDQEISIEKGSNYRKAVNISNGEQQIMDGATGDTLGNISYKSGETITINDTTYQVAWEGKELYYSTNNQKVLRATYEKGKDKAIVTLLKYEEVSHPLEYFALNKMIYRLDTKGTASWAPAVLLGLVGVVTALNKQ